MKLPHSVENDAGHMMAVTEKVYLLTRANSEDSDQPAHPD